ncbi:MAG: glycoside hydrolase family 3 N-terminal domain-containing protein, partial [Opitutaceae bacterium]
MPRPISVPPVRGLLLALLIPACARAEPSAGFAAPEMTARADALLARMTLEEKAGQLNQLSASDLTGPGSAGRSADELIRSGLVGAILNSVTAQGTNAYQKEAVGQSRLGIPILFGLDVIHGFRTLFPIPLGLSATWDTGLIEQTARFAAGEASRQGVRWTFAPMVDIARDPRWGRIAEGAGEDPYLGSAIARAYVRGYQGTRLDDPTSILACAKHFVGYGAAEGGRDYNTTEISERTLRQVYLPPFHAAVDEGAGTIMSAFNSLDEVPASANAFTLTRVLRGEWKFEGFVDSDWAAVKEIMVHGIANDARTAARKGILAGVDMDMVDNLYAGELPGLVRSGAVPMQRLDEAVRRVLRIKFALGLFERPYVAEPAAPADIEGGRALALRAAEESFVLLENRLSNGSPLLPLSNSAGRKIALIGPLADSAGEMKGSWYCQAQSKDVVTLRSALAERAQQGGMALSYAKGTDIDGATEAGFAEAVAAAKGSDVAVLALGESGESTGEASSRSRIGLPGNQEELLEAVAKTGTPIVLIVFSGRPLATPWAAEHVQALLLGWFPGIEAGPALVRTLFGDAEPQGRLTVSIPRSVGQIPVYYNALNSGRPKADSISPDAPKPGDHYVNGYIDEDN